MMLSPLGKQHSNWHKKWIAKDLIIMLSDERLKGQKSECDKEITIQ